MPARALVTYARTCPASDCVAARRLPRRRLAEREGCASRQQGGREGAMGDGAIKYEALTPADVLAFDKPSGGFCCSLQANKYGISFLEFEIKDYDTKRSVFKIAKDANMPDLASLNLADIPEEAIRTVRYTMPADFLRFKTVRTELKFSVGALEVPSFRMIERHYFRGELIRSYDFQFGFCIPNSTNTWEAIYDMPENSEARIGEFIASPNAHQTDSFYFVGEDMVMHNKAYFSYEEIPATD